MRRPETWISEEVKIPASFFIVLPIWGIYRKIIKLSMKKLFFISSVLLLLVSCKSGKYLSSYVAEEIGLNMTKITDETQTSVVAGALNHISSSNERTSIPGSRYQKFAWSSLPALDISPEGDKLVFLSSSGSGNESINVIIRTMSGLGMPTQRTTSRKVYSVCWGKDSCIYFAERGSDGESHICSISAIGGSLITQHTTGDVFDDEAILSDDGRYLYFTRSNRNYGPAIWRIDLTNNSLTACSQGYCPCPIEGTNDAYYCVRNSSSGRSEIWYVDFVKGIESIILTDDKISFSQPRLSPDGNWLVCEGNSKSNISKKNNVDIFMVKTDGSNLMQLTYHPAMDLSPVWSLDGKSIYFISSRANKEDKYNIWKMDIPNY